MFALFWGQELVGPAHTIAKAATRKMQKQNRSGRFNLFTSCPRWLPSLSHHSPADTWPHGGVYTPASFVCMSCVSHGSCLEYGFTMVHVQSMHSRFFTWKPKIATCPSGKPSSHLSGGISGWFPSYSSPTLLTPGDVPQQFLQEFLRAALRRFRRFLRWACHQDRMGPPSSLYPSVRFFLGAFSVVLGYVGIHKIYVAEIWGLHSEDVVFQNVNQATASNCCLLSRITACDLIWSLQEPRQKHHHQRHFETGESLLVHRRVQYTVLEVAELLLGEGILSCIDNSYTGPVGTFTHKILCRFKSRTELMRLLV